MPDVTLSLTDEQVARLREAWEEEGVPLQRSVLKALAGATREKIRDLRRAEAAAEYVATAEADDKALDIEFGEW